MKKSICILVISVIILGVFYKLIIKDLSAIKVTSVGGIFLNDIQVESDLFKANVTLGTSTAILTDYTVNTDDDKIIITVYSKYFISENEKIDYVDDIVYNADMSNINSIVIRDSENEREIWNNQKGIVWTNDFNPNCAN